jgi:hypothetical protein
MHHADAFGNCIARGVETHRGAVDLDLAAVGFVETGKYVHQRALARAVFSQQRMNLAALQGEVHMVVGQHTGKADDDVLHLYRIGRFAHDRFPGSER